MNPEELERLRAEALKIVYAHELTGLCTELARAGCFPGNQLGASMSPTEVRAFLRGTWMKRNARDPGNSEAKQHHRIAETRPHGPAAHDEELAPARDSTPRVQKRTPLELRGEESLPELAVSEEVVLGGVMRDIPSERRHAATCEFLDAIIAIHRDFNVLRPSWLGPALEMWHFEHVDPPEPRPRFPIA